MNRVVLIWVLLTVVVGAVGPEGVAGPDEQGRRCWVDGAIRRDGTPVPARVEVRLFHENSRHPHGFYWTAEHTLRYLQPPPGDADVRALVSGDENGRFAVHDLAPGRYLVRATDADGSWGGVLVPLDVEGQHQRVTIAMRAAGARLAGRLRHVDGRPFAGLVLASRESPYWGDSSLAKPAHLSWAAADEEGRFAFEDLFRGQVYVTALAPGRFRRTLRRVEVPLEGELDLVVDDGKRPTVGRVLDIETDEAIEGARVVWMGHYDGRGPCCGAETTAEDGSYLLRAPRGVYQMHVGKPGYVERFSKDLQSVGDGTLRLRRGSRVVGRVVTAGSGEPVAGLLVERRGPGSYWYQWTRAVTDAEGRFVLSDQAPGWGRVYARSGVWIPGELEARRPFASFEEAPRTDPLAWYVPPREAVELELEVVRGATVEGRVVDHAGRPVAGVPILAEGHGDGDPAFSWTGIELPALAASDADGSFRVEGLVPGERYELEARPTGGAPASAKLRLPAKTAVARRVELRLPEPHWILVEVVDADTLEPLAGAEVSLMLESRDERLWWSGADGEARVGPLGPVRGTLDVTARGYLDANQRDAPRATREGARVHVALDRALEVRGVVRMPDGAPASDAVVYTANVSDSPLSWDHYRGRDRCRPDGSFTVDRVRAIDYEVRAVLWRDAERFEAKTVVRGGTHHVALVLAPAPKPKADPPPIAGPAEERPTVLVVHVVDGEGRPVPRARCRVPGGAAEVVDGRVELTEPWPQDHPVEVWNARAEDGIRLPLGPLRLDRPPVTTGEFTLSLPPERVIEGRVTGPDGSPVARVQVEAAPARFGITPPPHGLLEPEPSYGVSDTTGRFRLGGLGDEEQVLRLTLPAGWLAPVEVLRTTPDDDPVEIRVRAAITIEVVVTDPHGKPVEGATVGVRRDGWNYFWRSGWTWRKLTVGRGRSDASGRCVLSGIDPLRRHVVLAEPPEGREDLEKARREVDRPQPVALRLRREGTIAGRIVSGAGATVAPPAVVLWRQGDAWQARHVWKKDGTFTLRLDATGEIEVAAGLGIMRAPHATTEIVETVVGARDLEILLDPGAELPLRVEGWEGTEDRRLRVHLREEDAEGGRWVGTDLGGPSGRIRGLDPRATYTLWVVGAPRGRCARVTGVTATKEVVEIRLEPGLTIRGRVASEADAAHTRVRARAVEGGPWVDAVLEDGTYTLGGLTPGRWRVRASAIVGSWPVSAETWADAGGTADLELRLPLVR